jgi:hypothetical protein
MGQFSAEKPVPPESTLSGNQHLNPSECFPPGQPKTTELTTHARLKKPAIGEIEANLVAQAALGPDAHAVADD